MRAIASKTYVGPRGSVSDGRRDYRQRPGINWTGRMRLDTASHLALIHALGCWRPAPTQRVVRDASRRSATPRALVELTARSASYLDTLAASEAKTAFRSGDSPQHRRRSN